MSAATGWIRSRPLQARLDGLRRRCLLAAGLLHEAITRPQARIQIPYEVLGTWTFSFALIHHLFLAHPLKSIQQVDLHSPNINPSIKTTAAMRVSSAIPVVSVLFLATGTVAGPVGYGVCQAGCAGVVMACYSAAGFTWGATMGASAPATVLACNSAFGSCQAACAAVLLWPTP